MDKNALADALRFLAQAITQTADALNAQPRDAPPPTEAAPPKSATPPKPDNTINNVETPAEPITQDTIRKVLKAKAQAGLSAQSKALLTEFGIAKLSDLPQEKFAEFLAKAEVLK